MSNDTVSQKDKDEKTRISEERIQVPAECLDRINEAIESAKKEKLHAGRAHRRKMAAAAAAFFISVMALLPNVSVDAAQAMCGLPVVGGLFEVITVRDYHYADGRFSADVSVPEIESDSEAADSVNGKINDVAEEWVDEFEKAREEEWGSANIVVDYEILSTAPEYFTLKLTAYQGSGSGYEQDYYYTIRLSDEKEMSLSDLFPEGADFVTPISENIKQQMRSRTEENPDLCYWVDMDDDDPGKAFEFNRIENDQQFYIDEYGQVVIAFSEGDAAPMYMGCVQFTIPKYITDGIG